MFAINQVINKAEVRRDNMLFKVLYQDIPNEVPVRERTKSLYYEAKNERQVRKELSDRKLNIEFVQPLVDAHLEYEQQSEDFAVENA
jgi:DNA-dependent RNA polymerase auxiliary subunit epsilon